MDAAMDIDAILNEAEQRCRDSGGRMTTKRKQVLSGLLRSGGALSAYELAEYCRGEYGDPIPAMSVYRILDFLQGQDLVHKLNVAGKYVACAHITCEHEHGVPQFLICRRCQRVEEIRIENATIKALRRSVEQAGFDLASQQIEMDCVCEDCKGAE